MVRGGIREFVNDMDGPAFLERELMVWELYGYWQVRVHDPASGLVSIYTFVTI
jgi:hypothetical protein